MNTKTEIKKVVSIKETITVTLIEAITENKNPKKNLFQTRKLKRLLECFCSEKISKVLYGIAITKLTNSTELQRFFGFRSRDPVVYYSMKARESDLIEIISPNNNNYKIYHNFWSELFPTTHEKIYLFKPTKLLKALLPHYKAHIESLISDSVIQDLTKRGEMFNRFMKSHKSKDKEKEKIAMNTIGACNNCKTIISKNDLKYKRGTYVADDLCCKECMSSMFQDGRLKKLYKRHKKNGHFADN